MKKTTKTMRKASVFVISVLAVAIVFSLMAVSGVFAADDYIDISSAAQLKNIASGKNYRLTADIAFTDGTTLPAFSGNIDGNGKKITGITAPLFEEISGSVFDLEITGSISSSSEDPVGALASKAGGDLQVNSVTVDCAINAPDATGAGGFIGAASANGQIKVSFENCVNMADVNAFANAAGFVGSAANTSAAYTTVRFDKCINYGNVHMSSGGSNIGAGGFVGFGGRYSDVQAYYCSNEGDISSEGGDSGVGGIYGGGTWSNGDAQKFTARYSSNSGDITVPTGRGRAGGICGRMNRNGSEYVIEYCYNTGTVTAADDSAAGIFSYSNSSAAVTIRYCYSIGALEGAARRFPIAGHGAKGSVVSIENYYFNCSSNYDGENVSANQASGKDQLNAAMLALENSPYVLNANMNGGFVILAWQCDHSTGERIDTCLGKKCSVCSQLVEIDPNGSHSFGEWIVDKEATEEEQGLQHRICEKCGEREDAVIEILSKVTPVDGVYPVSSGAQFVYVFNGIERGDIPAGASIRIDADISLPQSFETLRTTFTGVIDGSTHTISGVSRPLFTNFNGRVKSLTLEGSIDLTSSGEMHDTARKAASFALTADSASFIDVISEVDVATDENDLNAGGIVGYATGSCCFTRCEYNGTFTANWVADGAGVGGIVGWSNALGGNSLFVDCSFGGKIEIKGGAAGKNAGIGGIIGYCTNSNVVLRRCISYGDLISSVSAGNDYAGGIVGLNKVSETAVENCANKGSIEAVLYAGGIVGGILEDTDVSSCANYGAIKAQSSGAIAGTSGSLVLRLTSCVDFSSSGLDLCSDSFTNDGSYPSSEVSEALSEFSLGSVDYVRYSIGTVEKDTGLLVSGLSTVTMFMPYISLRDDGSSHSVRIVMLTNNTCKSDSATVSVLFKDENGKTVKSLNKVLSVKDSDFTLYTAVMAGGQKYFAAPGNSLFGLVVTGIPNDAWDSVEVSIKDTANGTTYLGTCKYELDSMQLSLDNLPSYDGLGDVADSVYNAGPGLASDLNFTTTEDSFMAVISNTTAEALEDYLVSLEKSGYVKISENTLDSDTYYTYGKFGALVYLYHNKRIAETRIIVDNSSDPLSELSYEYTPKAGEYTALYQYSLNYSNANRADYDPVIYTESGAPNNGMCYIIKLSDNKLVMIDSGAEDQSTAKSRAGLMEFMREITGTKDGEKVTIAMWYFTHAHGDHTALAGQFLKEYHDQVELEATAFNFPSYQVLGGGFDEISFTTKNIMKQYYPDIVYHKLHTGESFTLADLRIDVVYTHEDAVSAAGTTEIGDFNSTSTVLKMYFDGIEYMQLGDMSGVAEAAIVSVHSAEYLKSDMMQVAHHCFNYLDNLYPLIRADVALFPQSMYNCKNLENDGDNLYKYQSIMKYATQEYFAHKFTYKLTVNEDGEIEAEALPRYDAA